MSFRVLPRAELIALVLAWAGAAGCSSCGNGGGFDAGRPDVPVAGGTISLAWSLIDDATNRPVTCDRIDPNATVFVQLSHEGTGSVESFACKPLQGTSITAFPPGAYTATAELHMPVSGQAVTIATATPQGGVVIRSGQDIGLTPVVFHVNATGRLELMLRAGAAGNCAGGAAITGFSISLEHNGDPPDTGCAPVVFALSGGGTYNANDCSSPAVTRCIAASETLTVASLPSGPYRIHIRGKKGTLDCWSNDDALRVPPQGRSLAETLNLAFASEMPGCQ
ncbi:MAG: hypothetical protein E6J90_24620 [Deltaproteobacteria bacterium]|nr:MAG: hypothetical protein E6J90_24620 [Deltaproteobacteria bacterium]TMQ21820.1 MAG: hypothetical protein E6J91_02130 [Deltaproteobacteria bacterium]